jgi:hypothetical protein
MQPPNPPKCHQTLKTYSDDAKRITLYFCELTRALRPSAKSYYFDTQFCVALDTFRSAFTPWLKCQAFSTTKKTYYTQRITFSASSPFVADCHHCRFPLPPRKTPAK